MSYKIVVADASPSVQKAVQLAFPAAEWDIVSFDNGLELSKSIFEAHPDAILVSLTLPGMDGYAVGRFVRKQEEFSDTVLVFLKGAFETFDPQRAEGVDYDEVIPKPFDSAKLAVRIKNLIDAKGDHSKFPESPIPVEAAARIAPTPAAPTPTPAETSRDDLNLTGFSATPRAGAAYASRPTPSAPTPSAPTPVPPTSEVPLTPADLTDLERRLKEWMSKELIGMEREVEKRVRSQIATELKKWFAEHFISLPSKGK